MPHGGQSPANPPAFGGHYVGGGTIPRPASPTALGCRARRRRPAGRARRVRRTGRTAPGARPVLGGRNTRRPPRRDRRRPGSRRDGDGRARSVTNTGQVRILVLRDCAEPGAPMVARRAPRRWRTGRRPRPSRRSRGRGAARRPRPARPQRRRAAATRSTRCRAGVLLERTVPRRSSVRARGDARCRQGAAPPGQVEPRTEPRPPRHPARATRRGGHPRDRARPKGDADVRR